MSPELTLCKLALSVSSKSLRFSRVSRTRNWSPAFSKASGNGMRSISPRRMRVTRSFSSQSAMASDRGLPTAGDSPVRRNRASNRRGAAPAS